MKALVLAAGLGTRLGGLTRNLPKPMLPICGRPLLAYTLDYLAAHGFRDVAVNLHFLPETIRNYFGDGNRFGVRIHYSHEPRLLGTAGAVAKLADFFADVEEFLVVYGDLLVDHDLGALVAFHRQHRPGATLVLHRRQNSNSLVSMDRRRRIVGFVERPTPQERLENPFAWVNSGLQILSRRMLAAIPAGVAADLPRDVYAPLVRREALFGMPLAGCRVAIDSPERYAEAVAAVRARAATASE